MRRNGFICLVLAFFLALFVVPAPVSAVEHIPGKRMKSVPGAEKRTGSQQKGKADVAAKGAGSATDVTPGQINARSAVLMEVTTGTILFEQNADEPIEPASFTKIATLYLVFEALQQNRIHLNDDVWISEAAWRTGGSKMFVGIGTRVPLEELIKGIAVVSGNDACIATAEHLSGSVDTFVDAMNRMGKQLGMTRTTFLNPNGLPADGQITTARDMAILDTAYLKRFPESLKYHSMREWNYNNIVQYNRNHLLLKDSTIDGLKTGYIAASGYHLSATSQRDGMRLIAVVMGAVNPATREREALKLLNYGYRNFTLVQPFKEGQPITTVNVWKGQQDKIQIYPKDAPTFLIPQTQKNLLKWNVQAPSDAVAPIENGQELGQLVFTVSDQPKRTVALVSHEDVPLAGWFKRSWQSVAALIKFDWRWVSGILGGIAIIVIAIILLAGRKPRGYSR